ncbi:MAG TPA: hypothetical protein DCE52_13930 [Rhodobacteraceae bacterium]|nr:hypothetical protein [Paracoccaceae bacterium]
MKSIIELASQATDPKNTYVVLVNDNAGAQHWSLIQSASDISQLTPLEQIAYAPQYLALDNIVNIIVASCQSILA